MRQIWKYVLTPEQLVHSIPKFGHVRYVAEQNDNICIWVEVDSEQSTETRYFKVYGTGQPISENNLLYLGSVQFKHSLLVFHVYEERRFK